MRFCLLAGLAGASLFAQDKPAATPDGAQGQAPRAAPVRQEITVKARPLNMSTVFALPAKKCSIPLLIVAIPRPVGDANSIVQIPKGLSGASIIDPMPKLRGPAPSCDDRQ